MGSKALGILGKTGAQAKIRLEISHAKDRSCWHGMKTRPRNLRRLGASLSINAEVKRVDLQGSPVDLAGGSCGASLGVVYDRCGLVVSMAAGPRPEQAATIVGIMMPLAGNIQRNASRNACH